MTHTTTTPPSLQFLKLGGSLITDKEHPGKARPEVLKRLAEEIAAAWSQKKGGKLILGHGSGSFGHVAARRYGTRQGVRTPQGWQGFAQVWFVATNLTRLVIEALHAAGLPAIAFSPSACVITQDVHIRSWDIRPLRAALQAGLLPVVHGDVAFDKVRGGTIVSTEEVFTYLAAQLKPQRILIAGVEAGVWADYPACTQLVRELTPDAARNLLTAVSGSKAPDVTGGMASKVRGMLELVQSLPGLEVGIFSGQQPGQVQQALQGARPGTWLHG